MVELSPEDRLLLIDIRSAIEGLTTEVKKLRNDQQRSVFKKVDQITITQASIPMFDGCYYAFAIDLPGKQDAPIEQAGFMKKGNTIADILAISLAIDTTNPLKGRMKGVILKIQNPTLCRALKTDDTIFAHDEIMSKLSHLKSMMKGCPVVDVQLIPPNKDYRMNKIQNILQEAVLEEEEKENLNQI